MKNFHDELKALEPKMLQTLKETLRFKTVKDTPAPNAPFGTANAECLQYVLQKCADEGLEVKNFDGYAGHADFIAAGGENAEIIGVLGHLDVVPADEDSWRHPPYEAVEEHGEIFGRGIYDDKGPMIACLYAVLALKNAGFTPKKTIRLIFGCDEETNMDCMKYYFAREKAPNAAFSPDADFPCINREKGIIGLIINLGALPEFVADIYSGERTNVVPEEARATLCGVKSNILKQAGKNAGIAFTQTGKDGDMLTVITRGQSAHAAHPHLGDNAAWRLLRLLAEVDRLICEEKTGKSGACKCGCKCGVSDGLKFAADKMCDHTGKAWGVDAHDEPSGDLTVNIGIVRKEGADLVITVDIRHPVTHTNAQTQARFEAATHVGFAGAKFAIHHAKEPLFVDENSELVKTLVDVWRGFGHTGGAIAIGGGTYSRCIKNCVAFGPEFPGDEQTIHQPNERMSKERLFEIAEIYMEALRRLAE